MPSPFFSPPHRKTQLRAWNGEQIGTQTLSAR